jgi:hypothetical protein
MKNLRYRQSLKLFLILEFGIPKLPIFGDKFHSQFANHEYKVFAVREQKTPWDAGSIDFQVPNFPGYFLGYRLEV